MANLKLLWRNLGDAATLSGGNWTLALSKLQNTNQDVIKDIFDVARSNGLSTANTTFRVDLGANYGVFDGLVLANVNFSAAATIRIQCGDALFMGSSISPVLYDSGFIPVFKSFLMTGETDWNGGSWWWGTPTDAELSGYVKNYFHGFKGQRRNRYIQVTISDPTNTAGYVDIGRLMIGTSTTFSLNHSLGGHNFRWLDTSLKSRGMAAKVFADKRVKFRQSTYSLDWLSDSEAYTQSLEMERILGTTGEVFVIHDADDPQTLFRQCYLAQLSELSGIDKIVNKYHKTAYKFEEIL